MHGNTGTPAQTEAARNRFGACLGDVDAEIAAAGSAGASKGTIPAGVRANNLGMIGVAVRSTATGRELEFPISLELYEDLDAPSIQNYLADAAKRMGADVQSGARYRFFQLPDSY